MTPSDPDLARIAKLQARHQNVLIVLSVVVAVSAMVTWKSVSTLREANELQKQSLAGRKPDSPAKTALTRRSSTHQAGTTVDELRRMPSFPNGHQRNSERQTEIDETRSTQVAGASTVPARPGRQ